MIAAIFDRGRRETWFFTSVAVLLVLLRSAVFILRGYIDFNSDQAIVGLMAKHLSEFRHFPLFFYGQNYMLGVQSWVVAPFFWLARPSIAVLKTPLVLLNILAAVLLMRGLGNRLALRPALGFVAALPFIMPTPVVAGSFLQTLGASGVEPLLYVLFLWMLRPRPFAFGALLALGYLHREFTLYAIPALIAIHLADRSVWTVAAARWTAWMAGGFGLVWLVLDDLRFHLEGLSLFLQAQMFAQWPCLTTIGPLDRIRYVIMTCLPVLLGGTRMPLDQFGMRSTAVTGSVFVGGLVAGAIVFMLVRLAWLSRRKWSSASIVFAFYLMLVGCSALAGYALTCSYPFPVIRYFNLAILLPIGCFAAFVAWEPSASLKRLVVLVFAVWSVANLVDNVRTIRDAYARPLPDPHGELTQFLLGHEIRYARADYWDAYVVDFLSRERVIVGSETIQRIHEYETQVDEHRDVAVHVQREPCQGQFHVAAWCIQLPVKRPGEGPR
jgi:hypothetical protein